MSDFAVPDFRVGHWTGAGTGCTVIIPPPGTRGAVDVRGGGVGSRELEPLMPHANAEGPTAVLFTGGSAFGLGAADGVMRWLERHGLGRQTPIGPIPLVPTAVVFDLAAPDPDRRPGPDDGEAACVAATDGVPERGRIGAGTGATVGKARGRESGTPGGIGYAATRLSDGVTVAALAAVNAWGDVIGEDGSVLGGVGAAALVPTMLEPPVIGGNTTLVCVCTDAPLDKRSCGIVARAAGAGIARAVDPAFTPLDGDVVFCLASGTGPRLAPGLPLTWSLTVLGTVAATMTAAAIRDAVGSSG